MGIKIIMYHNDGSHELVYSQSCSKRCFAMASTIVSILSVLAMYWVLPIPLATLEMMHTYYSVDMLSEFHLRCNWLSLSLCLILYMAVRVSNIVSILLLYMYM